jgi:hypothetical protein
MDLLRRAFNEHPVASAIVAGLEIVAFVVVVSIIAGHVVVSLGGSATLIVGLVGLGAWRWWKRRHPE